MYKRHDDLLYKYTGIDRWKLEDEKRALLEECRQGVKALKKKG